MNSEPAVIPLWLVISIVGALFTAAFAAAGYWCRTVIELIRELVRSVGDIKADLSAIKPIVDSHNERIEKLEDFRNQVAEHRNRK